MPIQPISQTLNTTQNNKPSILDKIPNYVKNSADMTDSIVVPRTIFKGYLGIMTGTTLLTLGSLIKKPQILSKTLSISGVLASMYGTFAFVRPYIIRDAKGVEVAKIDSSKNEGSQEKLNENA